MIFFGHENGEALFLSSVLHAPVHVELAGDVGKRLFNTFGIGTVKICFNPHEKHAVFRVCRVLIRLDDIPAVFVKKLGDTRDNTRSVRARD